MRTTGQCLTCFGGLECKLFFLKNMESVKVSHKNNNQYKGNTSIHKKKKEKSIADHYRAINQGYSQKTVKQNINGFRPTSKINNFLENQEDKSATIREAMELLILKRCNPDLLLDQLSKRYPLNWRRINRRNGSWITNKIKELKNVIQNN